MFCLSYWFFQEKDCLCTVCISSQGRDIYHWVMLIKTSAPGEERGGLPKGFPASLIRNEWELYISIHISMGLLFRMFSVMLFGSVQFLILDYCLLTPLFMSPQPICPVVCNIIFLLWKSCQRACYLIIIKKGQIWFVPLLFQYVALWFSY